MRQQDPGICTTARATLSSPELRHRVQLQLNRGEARHEMVGRCLFFATPEFRSGDAEKVMDKAS
jgi:TnpA family transposase